MANLRLGLHLKIRVMTSASIVPEHFLVVDHHFRSRWMRHGVTGGCSLRLGSAQRPGALHALRKAGAVEVCDMPGSGAHWADEHTTPGHGSALPSRGLRGADRGAQRRGPRRPGAARKRTRELRAPRRAAYPTARCRARTFSSPRRSWAGDDSAVVVAGCRLGRRDGTVSLGP